MADLYEFYYTSSPLESQTKASQADPPSSLNSFHCCYNFHFASIDCIANGDECGKHGIQAWPTFLLYKNGELVEKYTGAKSMQGFSNYVEEKQEQIKPGSRPREAVKLPEPGASSVDWTTQPENPLAKDKDTAAGEAAGERYNDQAAAFATAAHLNRCGQKIPAQDILKLRRAAHFFIANQRYIQRDVEIEASMLLGMLIS